HLAVTPWASGLADAVHRPAERPPLVERDRRLAVVVGDDARVAADLGGPRGVVDQVVAAGRHDHVVAGGDVILGHTAGGAGPGIGADRVPIALAAAVVAVGELVGELVDL